jgi:hypothetical protein
MGVAVADKDTLEVEKRSLIGKTIAQFFRFFDWLAKGREGNLPCAG